MSPRCTIAALALAAVPLALANTVTLEPVKDNTLYESATGSLSNGSGSFLFAGRTNVGFIRRAVVEFDVAGNVPADSIITSVTVTMQMSRTIVGPVSVGLHPAFAEWGEAGSDAFGQEGAGTAAQQGDATWLHTFFDTEQWTSAGGDFAASASATIDVGSPGSYTWGSTADLVADVQGWLDDPASNHGWVVVADESTFPTAKRFNSRENGTPRTRPMLTIEYEAPPMAAGAVPDGDGVPGEPLRVERDGAGGVVLSWGASCLGTDTDYEVYQGTLDDPTTYGSLLCSTGSQTTATITPADSLTFWIVVPRNEMREGSYGRDSAGVERPQGQMACLEQLAGGCN